MSFVPPLQVPHTILTSSRFRPISYQRQKCLHRSALAEALLTHPAACASGHQLCISIHSPSAPPKFPWSSPGLQELTRTALHHLCCAGWKCCSFPKGAGFSLCLLSGHFLRAGLLSEATQAGSSFPGRDMLHPRTACLSHALAQQESRASLFWLKHQGCDGNIK